MVLAFYVLLLGLLSLAVGTLVARLFFKIVFSIVDSIWIGLGTIASIAGFWSFFGPLDYYFTVFLVVLSLFSLCRARESLRQVERACKSFWGLHWNYKMGSSILMVLILAAGSLSGYVLDNDSYYIQTIKWLDTYGLVPGIANWHLFLGQQSGFHVLEAALNLDFLNAGFNDVGLFMTLVMMLWSVLPANRKESVYQKAFRNLLVLILPVLLLLGTAPSPDVPVILIHYYVIYKFLFAEENHKSEHLIVTSFLVGLACYFKITSIFLVVFPLLMLLQWKQKSGIGFFKMACFPFIFAILFLLKNSMASGYPLFPLTSLSLDVDWLLPLQMAQYYTDATGAQAYGIAINELRGLNFWERGLAWIQQSGVEGWLNRGVVLGILMSGIGLVVRFKNSRIRSVFGTFLLFATALFYTSPQARFFVPFLFPILLVVLIYSLPFFMKHSARIGRMGIWGGLLVLLVPGLISGFTDNPRMKEVSRFTVENIIMPSAQSRFGTAFAKAKINNINYHDPKSADFFYGTYDIPLPAAQSEYLEYFRNYYNASPVYRGKSPKDGFRSMEN